MVRVTMEGGVNPYGQSDHKIPVFFYGFPYDGKTFIPLI